MATLPVKWELPQKFNQPGTTVNGVTTYLYDLETMTGSTTANNNITIPPGANYNDFANGWSAYANRDIIILGPRTKKMNTLRVYGGRRVAIIGGEWNNTGYDDNAIGVLGQREWCYIEGVIVTRSQSGDCLWAGAVPSTTGYTSAGTTSLYIQNCHFTGANGWFDGPHGDLIQQFGNASNQSNRFKGVYLYNCYGESGYQGWFFQTYPNLKGYDYVEMERIVTKAMTRAGTSANPALDGPKSMYYLGYNWENQYIFPAKLTDCHLIEGGGKTLSGGSSSSSLVHPFDAQNTAYDLVLSPAGSSWTTASWPNQTRLQGRITKGLPTTWSPVQTSQIGQNYTHTTSLYVGVVTPTPPTLWTGTSDVGFTATLGGTATQFTDTAGVRLTQTGDRRVDESGSDYRVTETYEGSLTGGCFLQIVCDVSASASLTQIAGERVTEAGDLRVAEESDLYGYRVTEKYHPGDNDGIQSEVSITANGGLLHLGTASISGGNAFAVAEGFITKYGVSAISSTSDVTSNETYTRRPGDASIDSTVTIAVVGRQTHRDSSDITSALTVSASGTGKSNWTASADISSSSSVSSGSTMVILAGSNPSSTVTVGSSGSHIMVATSTISSTASLGATVFYKTWAKLAGTWHEVDTWVKHSGVWKEPIATYIKHEGIWKRTK
jgi:hypothetical protein